MMNTGKGFPSRMRLVIFYCIKKMEFHVDKQTFYRNKWHDEPMHDIKIEANHFARELLMPEEKMNRLIKKYGLSLEQNEFFEKLSKETLPSCSKTSRLFPRRDAVKRLW